MGWLIRNVAPGIRVRRSRNFCIKSGMVRAVVHWSSGRSRTTGSLSFGSCGSFPNSVRPIFETTISTSGNSMIACCMCFSISMEAGRDTLGSRMVCGATEPSFRIGMNSLPRKGNSARLPSSDPRAAASTTVLCPRAHPSEGA